MFQMVNLLLKRIFSFLVIFIIISLVPYLFLYFNSYNGYNLKNIRNYTYEEIWKGSHNLDNAKVLKDYFSGQLFKNIFKKKLFSDREWRLHSLKNKYGVNIPSKNKGCWGNHWNYLKFIDSLQIQKLAEKEELFKKYQTTNSGRYYFLPQNKLIYTFNSQTYYILEIVKINSDSLIFSEKSKFDCIDSAGNFGRCGPDTLFYIFKKINPKN